MAGTAGPDLWPAAAPEGTGARGGVGARWCLALAAEFSGGPGQLAGVVPRRACKSCRNEAGMSMKTKQDRKSALSRGERVDRAGVFTSRHETGEGFLHGTVIWVSEDGAHKGHPYDLQERSRNVYEKKANRRSSLSLGERVDRAGVLTGRRGSGLRPPKGYAQSAYSVGYGPQAAEGSLPAHLGRN